jgi:hypothetical protein
MGFTTCVIAVEGRFVGWLEVVLTTLWRPCAFAEPEKPTAAKKAHTMRQTILLVKFKLNSLLFVGQELREILNTQFF